MQYQVGDVIQYTYRDLDGRKYVSSTTIESIQIGVDEETMLYGYWIDGRTGVRDVDIGWMPPDGVTLVRRRGCVMR